MMMTFRCPGILHATSPSRPHVCIPKFARQPFSKRFGHHRHLAPSITASTRAWRPAQHAPAPIIVRDDGAQPTTKPLRRLREESRAHPHHKLGRGRNRLLRGARHHPHTGIPRLLSFLLPLRLFLANPWGPRLALKPPLPHVARRLRSGKGQQPRSVDAPSQARFFRPNLHPSLRRICY